MRYIKQKMNTEKVDKKEVSKEGVSPSLEPVVEVEIAPTEVAEAEPEKEGNTPTESSEKEPLKELRKFPTLVDFFATVGVFVFSVLVGSLVAVLLMKSQGYESIPPHITFIYYLIQLLPTIAFLLWRRNRAGRDSGLYFGFRNLNLPMLLWGVVLLLATGVVIEPLLSLFPTEGYEAVMQTVGLGGWAILSTVVAAPILEEVLFRGLIFESCGERFGKGGALIISALLFGLIHGVPVQMVNAFVVGLILGYVYLRTRSLISVMIIHAVNNAIAYATIALFGNAGDVTLREVISQDWLYWVLYGLSALVFIWALVRLRKTLRDNTEVE